MNVESKLWKLVSLNNSLVMVIQKSSRVGHIVSASALPDVSLLAMMHENAFNEAARDAFHWFR